MYGYIYITTNIINNKIYVGQHTAKMFEPEKYIGSGLELLRAIEKYGKENFKNELLCECFSREELDEKEKYYINLYNSTNKNVGYNINIGGTGNQKGNICITNDLTDLFLTEVEAQKYLKNGWHIGRNMNKYINGMTGKHQSETQKQAASKACSYKRTDEQKENFSKAKKIKNKFICLRTPDNKSTIRCLITNKDKYLELGYLECNNKN